ncbi:hypothetical protein P168DRAFT_293724 [Aspergillus campestris IBT 28561]|uniref:Uncharacterized protein n=1 Tax=Aspergillus campestris (strain IBT 28561) TaxID=1392248 RepID=A0A2I1CR81_ASPC2|nr:uncharacterized protein P168DRAFT_293724 [Aspergillus campestris IBT 28561]PKY00132.1 hypothetical protein P168DRAFT_293724 [Aspergillus campestris IBT 28561]
MPAAVTTVAVTVIVEIGMIGIIGDVDTATVVGENAGALAGRMMTIDRVGRDYVGEVG